MNGLTKRGRVKPECVGNVPTPPQETMMNEHLPHHWAVEQLPAERRTIAERLMERQHALSACRFKGASKSTCLSPDEFERWPDLKPLADISEFLDAVLPFYRYARDRADRCGADRTKMLCLVPPAQMGAYHEDVETLDEHVLGAPVREQVDRQIRRYRNTGEFNSDHLGECEYLAPLGIYVPEHRAAKYRVAFARAGLQVPAIVQTTPYPDAERIQLQQDANGAWWAWLDGKHRQPIAYYPELVLQLLTSYGAAVRER